MPVTISSLWRDAPLPEMSERLREHMDKALSQHGGPLPAKVFFRADDIGVPGSNFSRLMATFANHQTPLNLAVVPGWLTRARWQALQRPGSGSESLWCWHQHGWRHINHESDGKKQEFGPARSSRQIADDIVRGQDRLAGLLEASFTPIFTPPWNRCDGRTLETLLANGFAAVSRSEGSPPAPPEGLPDLPVQVDLHTRKEQTAPEAWNALWDELEAALLTGCCGIMIHHQRMNEPAFDFLDVLLTALNRENRLQINNFTNMV